MKGPTQMQKTMEKGWLRGFELRMIVTAALLLTGGFGVARAATIDFTDANNPFNTSHPYTEYGFTVTPIVGTWAISGSNPAALDQSIGYSWIDVTGAGEFTFSSVGFMQEASAAQFTIYGRLGGNTVFTIYGAFPSRGQWATTTNTDYASQLIDTLRIESDTHLTYVDNIAVNPASGTPEPGTVALIGCGLAAVGLARFRRFRARG
jgi:hypothetical protein